LAITAPFGVDHEQDQKRAAGPADHVAALFAVHRPIPFIEAAGIVEHERGEVECNAVLVAIGALFERVPFKDHRIYSIPVYTGRWG
jgi:hypothetical protein